MFTSVSSVSSVSSVYSVSSVLLDLVFRCVQPMDNILRCDRRRRAPSRQRAKNVVLRTLGRRDPQRDGVELAKRDPQGVHELAPMARPRAHKRVGL